MKIGIHHVPGSFSDNWIEYCEKKNIQYKIVNCYDSDIIAQLNECEAFMWHFHQSNPMDVLFAKQLMYSLQIAGKKVFPDFNTCWHFDDKLGQKYLLEALDIPMVPTYVFYDKENAIKWLDQTTFPKVFKLRKGAGSSHVKLVKKRFRAKRIINQAFHRGFSQYDKVANLKDRWYKYQNGKTSLWILIKGMLRFGKSTEFSRIVGPEKGYIYFQDFVPENKHDIRVIVIGDKAFAIKRLVRVGDFRASGSGHVLFEKHHFNEETIKLSFEIADKIKSQCLALDFVYKDGKPLVLELSYGFVKEVYYSCVGYWDRNMNWYQGSFDAQSWMVDSLLARISF